MVAVSSTVITAVIPAILALLAMIVQVVQLNKPVSIRANNESKLKQDMTVMILLLTVVFFVCNTANIVSPWVSASCARERRLQKEGYVVGYVLGTLLPFINSLLSPVIMISRGAQLRRFVGGTGGRAGMSGMSTVLENASAVCASRRNVYVADSVV